MEKKDTTNRINDVLFIAVIILMTVVLTFLGVIYGVGTQNAYTEPKSVSLWRNSNGTELNGSKVTIKAGETVTLTCMLPEKISDSENLFIWNRLLMVDADVDGSNIFVTDRKYGSIKEYDIWDSWQEIDLLPEYSGKELTLHLTSIGCTRNFKCSNVYIGRLNDISHMAARISIPGVIEGVIVLIVAVLLFAYGIILKHYCVTEYRDSIFDLALMSFCVFIWIASNSPMMSMIFAHGSFRLLISVFTLFLSVIPCLRFYSNVLPTKQKHLRITLIIYSGLILALILALMFAGIRLNKMFVTFIFITSLVHIDIAYCCVSENHVKKDNQNGFFLLSDAVLMVGLIVNAALYFTENNEDSGVPFRIAYILTLICLGLTLVRKSMAKFAAVRTAAKYREMAYVDKVTGGETRLRFAENLKSRRRDCETWFINIDLLNFKLVNQSYGWDMGNRMLTNMYAEISRLLDEGEHVCNLGNASFGCLLYPENQDDLKKRIGAISQGMKKCARSIDRNLLVKIGFYVCMITEDEESLDELLDRTIMANRNQYAEYISDLNCYVYNEKCRQELLFDKDLENLLGSAIADNEFLVYYQPKIELATGKMAGAEALVRWNSAKYGMLMPGRFIPLFEQNGLIADVDLNVLKQVCENISHWLSVGIEPPKVSVNISKAVVYRDDIMNRYKDIITSSGIPTKYLEFELTEGLAYSDYNRIQKLIDRIHAEGATCSMDDFGELYSNLNALDTLNFDVVKMDKSFFDNGFPVEQKKYKMVEGTLKLLKGLKLEVVAEGIEAFDQVAELKKLGCDIIQGFYYAKPLPIREFEMFMRASDNKRSFEGTYKAIKKMI